MDHHLYDHLSDTLIKKRSKPQPFINLIIKLLPEDHIALGFSLNVTPKTIKLPGMANTGCQSFLAGIQVIHKLGLTKSDLIPVTMKMHAANNGGITILGATILRVSGLDNHGEPVETRQMTYVTDHYDKLFLSREVCVALGIIPDSFPSVGTCSENMIATDLLQETQNCQCPTRQLPPLLPTTLPFTATDNNRLKLLDFLLNHYKSSTFNTCEHQTLPLMRIPTMRLMVEPDAKPVAHQSPVPVQIHWQEEVKAGHDQDVRLGVI